MFYASKECVFVGITDVFDFSGLDAGKFTPIGGALHTFN